MPSFPLFFISSPNFSHPQSTASPSFSFHICFREVIIEKHWRGVTSRAVCDFFWDEVNKYDSKEEMPPVVATSKYYLISIFRDDVFLMVTSTGETQPLLAIEFLHRVFDIFEEYFGTVEESTIKENFATVYQLLEEMMDYGYPLTTEPNALKAMIKPASVISRLTSAATGLSNVSDVLPDGTISNMPWRKTGVKYAQNEIYLDIIAEIDAIVDKNGLIISSEVSGAIAANSRLSGVPDLALSFANPGLIDDCSFHPCVRYTRFERDKIVSFVPPDGPFELMRYRYVIILLTFFCPIRYLFIHSNLLKTCFFIFLLFSFSESTLKGTFLPLAIVNQLCLLIMDKIWVPYQ